MVFHRSLNPERKLSFAIPLAFIAILGGTTAVLEVAIAVSPQSPYASNPQAPQAMVASLGAVQQTAAPASQTDGQCQRAYDSCMQRGTSNTVPRECEPTWRACVTNKCQKIDTKTIDQCLKDSDCISSCTELTAANGALKSCCSVIEHNNACRTKIEGIRPSCNPEQTKLPGGGTGSGTGTPPPANLL